MMRIGWIRGSAGRTRSSEDDRRVKGRTEALDEMQSAETVQTGQMHKLHHRQREGQKGQILQRVWDGSLREALQRLQLSAVNLSFRMDVSVANRADQCAESNPHVRLKSDRQCTAGGKRTERRQDQPRSIVVPGVAIQIERGKERQLRQKLHVR